ncbi:MAG: hypothetical protein PHC51_04795 [bacterium]|nr:hypothetical protein [bacterium]
MSVFLCTKFFSQLHFSGKDARRYLQGRLTQDLNRLNEKNLLETLLLTPAGQLCGKALLSKDSSGYNLFVETLPANKDEQTKIFTDELLRFKVADQIECQSVAESPYQIICYDKEDTATLPELPGNPHCLDLPQGGIAIFKEIPTEITRILTKTENQDESIFANFRLRNRYPFFSVDMTEKNSVAQVPMSNTVSFGKGCYAGQEVVERVSSRGKISEKLIAFIGPVSLSITEVEAALLDSGLTAVHVTGYSPNPHDNCGYGFAWIKGFTEESKLPDGFSFSADQAQ